MNRLKRIRHSLTTHALLLALVNAALVLVLGLLMMGLAYERDLFDFVRAPVGDRILAVSRKIALDLLENDSESWDAILRREGEGTPFHFVLLDSEGRQIAGEHLAIPQDVLQFSDNHKSQLTYTPKWDSADRPDTSYLKGNFYLKRDPQTHLYWAGVHVLIHFMDDNMYGHGTLVWQFSRLWTNPYIFNFWPYVLLLGGALLLTLLCWLPAVGLLLRRVSRLTTATREIAKGNFDTRLPSAGKDELGQLTASVALMSRQIAGLIHQQQRFVSDAAHELCSPVSRMQMAIELLRSGDRNAAGAPVRLHQQDIAGASNQGGGPHEQEAGTYFNDLEEEVQQMSEVVQDLLLYSRTRSDRFPVQAEDVLLRREIEEIIDREDLADKGVLVDIAPSIMVHLPAGHLRRAVANLLRNARQYAGDAGNVEVTAHLASDPEGDRVHLFVRDHGPGIPEDELEMVFAPFYRVEYARSRRTGGTGLGLAIVKSSVEFSGGTVQCRNRKPHGLEVEMTLPAASASAFSKTPAHTTNVGG